MTPVPESYGRLFSCRSSEGHVGTVPPYGCGGRESVLHAPNSSGWYTVYHRRPLGETDRSHRVVSIDELQFEEKGLIKLEKITKEGLAADVVQGAKKD